MIENVRKEAVEEEEEGEHGAKQSWFSLIQKVFVSPSISQAKKCKNKKFMHCFLGSPVYKRI